MSSILPRGFVDINFALSRHNTEVNLMGVVTDFLAPGPSRGTDLMCTFSIADPTYGAVYDDGLKVRFFRPLASEMPAIKGTGDVVLLRNIKIKEWSGMTVGLSTRGTSWVVFPAESIPTDAPSFAVLQLKNVKAPRGLAPSHSEMHYAISLCNSRDRSTFTSSSSPPTGSAGTSKSSVAPSTMQSRDKFSLLKDVNVDTFYNLVAQVVKLYPSNGRLELYITDYTRNCLVWDYPEPDDGNGSGQEGDEYNYTASGNKKWNGPYGKMTLTVTLWGNNAYFVQQNIKENDFVHLRNVHIKWSRDAKVEGALHTDRRYPDRIDVTVLKNVDDDDRVKDVLRRKRDYWKKFNNKAEEITHQTNALKRKGIEGGKPLSKNQARKRRKQESKQLSRSKDQEQGEEDQSEKENDMKEDKDRRFRKKQTLDRRSPTQKPELNNNVRCAHHLIRPRPVSSIISLEKHTNTPPEGASYTLPFQNINSRATVRVIDFFPPNLVDFAVPCPRASEYDILTEDECSESGSDRSSKDPRDDRSEAEDTQWEWRFGLVLEDALGAKHQERATIEVYVAGQDAEGLLNLEAEDLRKSPTALDTLREKLFLLWGDLEERKARSARSLKSVDGNSVSRSNKIGAPRMKPFQCCIKEYGVRKKKKGIQRITEGNGSDGESESEDGRDAWDWERRWRMFGCTIS